MLNNSQGSQGNNDLQTAQNAIAILIDQISKARGVGRTIVIDKNWLNNQLSALQNSLPAAVHQAQAVLKEKEATLSRAQQEAEMQRQTAADDAQRLKAQAEKEAAAARAEGLSVCLSSAYRSYNEQTYLFNRKVSQCGGDEAAAARIVNRPGTSEHQLGLCADITDKFYEVKTRDLEKTALYQWMYAHCQDYGFILRYPADKQDITGVMYEPWHFRYVGKEAAAYIMGNGLCLEEFLDLYK